LILAGHSLYRSSQAATPDSFLKRYDAATYAKKTE